MNGSYEPIDCADHDRLEALAVERREARIVYRDDSGREVTRQDRIVDVFTERDAEFLTLADDTRIRLDALVSVEGRTFSRAKP
ncbi:MAG: hypothetical protein ACREKN_02105 [Longimicrobiaceae bacterium]